MSWLIFLGNLAKILFLDTHAKILQVRTYLDIILPCYMARSWQNFPRLSMFLIKAIKFHFTGSFLKRINYLSFSVILHVQVSLAQGNQTLFSLDKSWSWVGSAWQRIGLGSVHSAPGLILGLFGLAQGWYSLFGLAYTWIWVCSVWIPGPRSRYIWPVSILGWGLHPGRNKEPIKNNRRVFLQCA